MLGLRPRKFRVRGKGDSSFIRKRERRYYLHPDLKIEVDLDPKVTVKNVWAIRGNKKERLLTLAIHDNFRRASKYKVIHIHGKTGKRTLYDLKSNTSRSME